MDWTVPAFAVLLPLFGLVWWGFQRREGALRDLAEGKVLIAYKSLHCHPVLIIPFRRARAPSAAWRTERRLLRAWWVRHANRQKRCC